MSSIEDADFTVKGAIEPAGDLAAGLERDAKDWEGALSPARQALGLAVSALKRIRENTKVYVSWWFDPDNIDEPHREVAAGYSKAAEARWKACELVNAAIRQDVRLVATLTRDAWAYTKAERPPSGHVDDESPPDPFTRQLRMDRKKRDRREIRDGIKEVRAEVAACAEERGRVAG